MDFPLSNLSSLTLSVLGLVTLELSLLVDGKFKAFEEVL